MSLPYVIEGSGQNEKSYDLFSRLMKDRIIFIGKEFSDEMANVLIGQMLFLEADDPEKDITIYINSPGGVVTACLAIYDVMNYVKPDISTVCVGMAASAASFILASGAKGKRYALKNSQIMIHQVSGGMNGSIQDVRIQMEEMDRLNDLLVSELATIIKKPLKILKKDMDRDYYMTSEEALKYGIIDEILTSRS